MAKCGDQGVIEIPINRALTQEVLGLYNKNTNLTSCNAAMLQLCYSQIFKVHYARKTTFLSLSCTEIRRCKVGARFTCWGLSARLTPYTWVCVCVLRLFSCCHTFQDRDFNKKLSYRWQTARCWFVSLTNRAMLVCKVVEVYGRTFCQNT